MRTSEPALVIRPAQKDDVKIIFGFIRELAEFEKLSDQLSANEEDLEKNLFGPHPYAECFACRNKWLSLWICAFFS